MLGVLVEATLQRDNGSLSLPELAGLGAELEAAGIDALYLNARLGESPQVHVDPFVGLGAVATSTVHLRLGALVDLSTGHSPAVVAKALSSLEACSNGRGEVLLVASEQQGESTHRELARLSEALEVLEVMTRAARPSFSGAYFRIENAYNEPHARVERARSGVVIELSSLVREQEAGDEALARILETVAARGGIVTVREVTLGQLRAGLLQGLERYLSGASQSAELIAAMSGANPPARLKEMVELAKAQRWGVMLEVSSRPELARVLAVVAQVHTALPSRSD